MAGTGKIRLLIVEDNAAYRHAIREILEQHPTLEIVGEAADGEAAIIRAAELQPTIVLMDINMPKLDGIAATRRIKANHKNMTVIGLSVHAEGYYLDAMLNAGAAELLPKEKASDHLYAAIERATAGTNQSTP
jgi:DNA-binding NarL/FixJ family response regulator